MVRFLQISDIHFRRLPDARDEYAQLKARLFEKVREICTTSKVDCILPKIRKQSQWQSQLQ